MNKYFLILLINIILVILFSGITLFLIFTGSYWVGVLVFFFLIASVFCLFSFQTRNLRDMKRLIDAIQFTEFNISFRNYKNKGLNPELIPYMQKAISKFNSKLIKMEGEQNFYNSLLNRIDFGIMVTDKNQKITWINKQALDFFRKPLPRKIDDLKKVNPYLPELLINLAPHETKTIKIEQRNSTLHLAVTFIYFTLEGKQIKLFSLKNIRSVLEENESEAWKKLIRVLTHEIMNSITPIISLSETFAEPEEENREMLSRAMQTIHRRSKGLVEFVHNYQKLSKIPIPTIDSFPAKEMMEDITHLLQADGLSFNYTVRPENIFLSADRSQIEQVMLNLIKNAQEATSQNKESQIKVDISLNEYKKTVIRVMDDGEGILPEVLDKIFIPFFTTKSQGSGIGLSICRQIINLHGGTITVHSETGKGSCFSIHL